MAAGLDMEQAVAALHGEIDRPAIGEVAQGDFHRQIGQIAAIAAGADEDTHRFTLVEQMPHHGRADKAGSSRHQCRHGKFLNVIAPGPVLAHLAAAI